MAYATPEELGQHLDPDPLPANAQQLLDRASRNVDQALLCSIYDPTDPDVQAKLKEATLEQVAAGLDAGDRKGTGRTTGGFSIGRLSVQRAATTGNDPTAPVKIGYLWAPAWYVLQQAGLVGGDGPGN